MAEPTWITVGDAAAHPAIGEHSPEDIGRVLEAVELRIEGPRATGVAWTPRTVVEYVLGDGGRTLRLAHVRCRTLDDVEVAGETQDLAGWTLSPSGRLRAPRRIPAGASVGVTYTHGADEPPPDLLDAALRATGTLLGHSRNPRIGERTETLVGEGATINFAAIPDAGRGRPFGMPDVDTVVMSHAEQMPAIA